MSFFFKFLLLYPICAVTIISVVQRGQDKPSRLSLFLIMYALMCRWVTQPPGFSSKVRILQQQGETSGGKLNRAELSHTQLHRCQFSVFWLFLIYNTFGCRRAGWKPDEQFSPSGFFSFINLHHWNQMWFFLGGGGKGGVEGETIFFLSQQVNINNKPTRQELMRECRWGCV